MVDVIVALQGTFGPPDDPRGTFFQVVTEHGLLRVIFIEIFEIATVDVIRTGFHAFVGIFDKGRYTHGVFPEIGNKNGSFEKSIKRLHFSFALIRCGPLIYSFMAVINH